jgi:PAS domain S-box-containing protein
MAQPLEHLDPRRLAAAVELAAGAVPAADDHALATALLTRLCALVEATRGVLEADAAVAAHVSWGGAAGGPESVLRLPLVAASRAVGTLELARDAGAPFTAADRVLVELVSPRFALLLERQRLVAAEADARAAAVSQLRLRQERFEVMIDSAFEFIGLLTPDGLVLEVNRAALDLVGVTRDDVVMRPFWETPWWAHDAAQRERLRAAIAAAAAGAPDGFDATHRARDGADIMVDFSVRPVPAPDGACRYLVVEGADVTAHRHAREDLTRSRDELVARVSVQAGRLARAEGALEETQALHQAVVETIVDGIVVIDAVGIMAWSNVSAQRMFGYRADELEGRNVSMLMPPHESGEHDGYLRHYLATGTRRIIGIGREVRGRRKDGSEFPLYLAVGETSVNGERKFTGILRDLSETKRLEQLLQERQTLARIGELASVVAHEVRNPLAAIRGVVEVIQTRFPAESSDRKVLGDLLTRVDSLDHLVGDLLVYARPAPPVFRRASLLGLVRDTVALVANDPAATPMRFEVSGEDVELWLDTAQMGRAVLNLMTNAAQAMRYQGVVRVTGHPIGDRYRLRVLDEGPGMPDDVRARCLEPFFTTKTRGTGLGLPIAKRVVDEHGGHFGIASIAGAGTEVTIDLPLAAAGR